MPADKSSAQVEGFHARGENPLGTADALGTADPGIPVDSTERPRDADRRPSDGDVSAERKVTATTNLVCGGHFHAAGESFTATMTPELSELLLAGVASEDAS